MPILSSSRWGAVFLEPVAGVHLAVEVLAGHHLEVGRLVEAAAFIEGVVNGLEHEGNEADAALHRHELEVGVAGQHARSQQVGELGCRS